MRMRIIHGILLFAVVCLNITAYLLRVIANMDETPLTLDMLPNRTIHNTGEKTIKIRTTGNEKNHVTVVLACAGDGSKLRPRFGVHSAVDWSDKEAYLFLTRLKLT